MGGVGTNGRDPLLWREKRKGKRGWGSIGLYLDKRKTMELDKDTISNCRTFSGMGPAALFTHLEKREASPVLST